MQTVTITNRRHTKEKMTTSMVLIVTLFGTTRCRQGNESPTGGFRNEVNNGTAIRISGQVRPI